MTIEQIKKKLRSEEYDFLRKDKNLGNNIIILTLGGSHAYGTNTETSDLDIRGCALNSKMQSRADILSALLNMTKPGGYYVSKSGIRSLR